MYSSFSGSESAPVRIGTRRTIYLLRRIRRIEEGVGADLIFDFVFPFLYGARGAGLDATSTF